jgi:hypothetical protein
MTDMERCRTAINTFTTKYQAHEANMSDVKNIPLLEYELYDEQITIRADLDRLMIIQYVGSRIINTLRYGKPGMFADYIEQLTEEKLRTLFPLRESTLKLFAGTI